MGARQPGRFRKGGMTGEGDYRQALGNAERLLGHLEAYAGAARAFDSYQIALAVFAER
jgi:hypothetical protein